MFTAVLFTKGKDWVWRAEKPHHGGVVNRVVYVSLGALVRTVRCAARVMHDLPK